MRIVSIDSSHGSQLLVADAVLDAEHATLSVLSLAEQAESRRHAESLGGMLAEALSSPAVAERRLDAVVAATGPAPFTGLRAGLVTARALGRARGIPVHGVPSLDAVARAALDELADEGATVLVTTDARRHEVYAARYRARGADDVECLDGPAVLTPDESWIQRGGLDRKIEIIIRGVEASVPGLDGRGGAAEATAAAADGSGARGSRRALSSG